VFKVVPKVLDRDDETSQPLCKTRLVAYIKQQQQQAAAAAAVKVEAAATGPASSGSSSSSSGIVYCLSRKEAEEIAAFLREVGGISAGHYHAGMTPKQRMEVHVITVL
jgi:superfamily II DNA helicase RecQ